MAVRSLLPSALALGLAACSEAGTAAPAAPAESAKPATPSARAVQPALAPETGADLERSCREVVSRIYGQEGTAVTYAAQGAGRANVSWRAPVDGGVLQMECRADQTGVGLFREGQPVSPNTQAADATADEEAR